MKSIIIFSENNRFTTKIFDKNFLKINNLKLKCIVAVQNEIQLIKDNYESIDLFSHTDFEKGKIDQVKENQKNQLDENILNEFSDTQILSCKFLDFYNPSSDKFSLRDERQSFYHSLFFVLNFLSKYEPDLVFFSNTPHSFTGIIFALVCKKRNIEVIFKREISIPGKFIFQNDLFENKLSKNNSNISNIFKKIIYHNEIFLQKYKEKVLESNHLEIKKMFLPKRDHFLVNNLKRVKKFSILFFLYFQFRQFVVYLPRVILKSLRDFYLYLFVSKDKTKIYLEDFWKNPKKNFSDSATLKIFRDLELFRSDFKKYKLLKIYDSKTKKLSLEKKFIYFPLHYQPEATTYPFGNHFIDQLNAIKLLSSYIPDDFLIYVKEHPDTFNVGRESWIIGDFSRDKNFYEDLEKIKKVNLVPLDMSTLDLTKKSFAISTIAGAVGLEAVLQNKPALIFGSTWYEDCEGIYKFSNHENCKKVSNLIFEKKIKIDINKVNEFFDNAKKTIFSDNDFTSEENLKFIQFNFLEKLK